MIQKTRGLVLHTIKYTDNSVISHIYTENSGRQAFIISGTRSKKSPARINLLQHLSILEMEVYIKQSRDLQRVKELRLHESFGSIPYHPVKNAVALLVAEVLYRTLQEQESNLPMFSFLLNAIRILDLSERGYANFHLLFLMGLSRHLGFFPRNNYSAAQEFFDMENAVFTEKQPQHPYFISPPASRFLSALMDYSFEEMDRIKLNAGMRNILATGILDFYRFHLPGMGQVKSFPVLKEIF
ncbi:MAG: DNA repair protein RecO [Bacteroidales bacterium]